MSRRKVILGIIAIAFAACVVVAALYFAAYSFQHHTDGPMHVFSLDGNGPITDQEAIQWSKEVLISDGRFSPNLKIEANAVGSVVSRGDDPAFASVDWRDQKTYRQWFVQFTRLSGKVEAVSNAGM